MQPDQFVPNYTAANWGDNYPALLALKQKFDPNSLFIVRQGVGAENWDEDQVCPLACKLLVPPSHTDLDHLRH